jgi:hypothetical protein
MKSCTQCKQEKPLEDFAVATDKKSGRKSRCKKCDYLAAKARRTPEQSAKEKLHWKKYNRKRRQKRYGITPDEYDVLFASQSGKCAICKNADSKQLSVDHCHITGKVRELLCTRCNLGIGYFQDRTDLLLEAVQYLCKHAS